VKTAGCGQCSAQPWCEQVLPDLVILTVKQLPEKICVICQRPFSWRKKWARDWEEVKYCSERCRRNSKKRNE